MTVVNKRLKFVHYISAKRYEATRNFKVQKHYDMWEGGGFHDSEDSYVPLLD